MLCLKDCFVQATFFNTPIHCRILIHPVSPSIATPTGESWKNVTDRVLSRAPSCMLLELATKELERELDRLCLRHLDGWILNAGHTIDVTRLLERTELRYKSLANGIVAQEMRAALTALFTQEPALMAALSPFETIEEAVEAVLRRALNQVRFHWEVDGMALADAKSLALHLMMEFHHGVLNQFELGVSDPYMMPVRRFHRFESFYERMAQFEGLDERFDGALSLYNKAVQLLPVDGSNLFGENLRTFWGILAEVGRHLSELIESDLTNDDSFEWEDFDDNDTSFQDFNEAGWSQDAGQLTNEIIRTEIANINVGLPDIMGFSPKEEPLQSCGQHALAKANFHR